MSLRGKALLWAVCPLLLLTPLLLWLGRNYANQLVYEQRIRTQQILEADTAALLRAVEQLKGKLESLAEFVAAETAGGRAVDAERFGTFAAGLHSSSPWIRAFQIVADGVITHAYPRSGNEASLGYNLLADPRPGFGVEVSRAMETGRLTITGPVELLQGGKGIVIRKLVPRGGGSSKVLVGVVLNIAPLLAESGLGGESNRRVQLAIRREGGEVFFGSPTVFALQPVVHRLVLPEGAWELGGRPAAGWPSFFSKAVGLFHLTGGVIILLLGMLFYVLARRQEELAATVQDRTRTLQDELAARRQAEEQLRLIMDNLADLVAVLDLDGRRIFNSRSYQGILGDPSQLPGTSSFEAIHPDDRERVRRVFQETVRTGVGQRLEYRLMDQHGQVRCIESQGSVIRDAAGRVAKVLVVSRDVTARKLAEARVEASERKYRELVEHANSIILHWSRDGRILFLNEYGQRFFGYSETEILGRHVIGTLVPDSEASGRDLSTLMDRICANPAAFEQNVNENMRRNGERVWIAWTNKVELDPQGLVSNILSIGVDITARKRAEEEIRQLNADLERRVVARTAELALAKERAESADRVKSAFLATMSHELRTPLNSIIGFTGLMLRGLAGPLNEEQTKQLRMVKGSSTHLLELINDVLDISKIEAGQIEIAAEPFDLREAVQKAMKSVAPLAEGRQLALAGAVAPEVGRITGDRRRVEQVLLNLLSNAIKFTERGEVRLDCRVQGGTVVTRVQDTGMGIKPENLDRLFLPFRQLDTGLTRRHEGTGLGLAICKRLVERMGGTITVESVWGAGSTFQFTLPVQPTNHP